jgi:hypothetical protein
MQLKTHVKAGFFVPTRDVKAGVILENDHHASNRCPKVCKNYGGCPNGEWTTPPGAGSSVCGCYFPP